MNNIKQILFGKDVIFKLSNGVNQLTDFIKPAFGPCGKSIGLSLKNSTKLLTDSLSMVYNFYLEDDHEKIVLNFIKAAAQSLFDKNHDGIKTFIILTQALLQESVKYASIGENAQTIINSINFAVNFVCSFLENYKQTEISSTILEKIALTAALGNEEACDLVSEAFQNCSYEDCNIHLENSNSTESFISIEHGYSCSGSYLSEYFINNLSNSTIELLNPYILLINHKISSIHELLPALDIVIATQRPLFIISPEIHPDVIASLNLNNFKKIITIGAANIRASEIDTIETLQDISAITGASVFNSVNYDKLKTVKPSDFGICDQITVDSSKIKFLIQNINQERLKERIDNLNNKINNVHEISSKSYPINKEQLEKRIKQLLCKKTIIRIGGNTETEITDKKAKCTACVSALSSTYKTGFIPFGVSLLVHASTALLKTEEMYPEYSIGIEIVSKACEKPFLQLLSNAGYESHLLLNKLKLAQNKDTGFNIINCNFESIDQTSILDSYNSIVEALNSAKITACDLLMTDVIISDNKPL